MTKENEQQVGMSYPAGRCGTQGSNSSGIIRIEASPVVDVGWGNTTLCFAFGKDTKQAVGARAARAAVRRAFETWAKTGGVYFKFLEVDKSKPHDILIEWVPATDKHRKERLGKDMTGVVLAHADFPPRSSYNLYGYPPLLMHFDETEHTWVDRHPKKGNEWDIETVALHEIGHCLGILHNKQQSSAIMHDFIFPLMLRRKLTQYDVNALKRCYPQKITLGIKTGSERNAESSCQLQVRFKYAHVRGGYTSWYNLDRPGATDRRRGAYDIYHFKLPKEKEVHFRYPEFQYRKGDAWKLSYIRILSSWHKKGYSYTQSEWLVPGNNWKTIKLKNSRIIDRPLVINTTQKKRKPGNKINKGINPNSVFAVQSKNSIRRKQSPSARSDGQHDKRTRYLAKF